MNGKPTWRAWLARSSRQDMRPGVRAVLGVGGISGLLVIGLDHAVLAVTDVVATAIVALWWDKRQDAREHPRSS